MNFKVFIENMRFELINVSTASNIDFKVSSTIVDYHVECGMIDFNSTMKFDGEVTREEATWIIQQELNE